MHRPKAVFTLDENILSELSSIAEELNEKKSHIVEKALELYFDLLDVKIADKRVKDFKEGKEKVVMAEDVWEKLNL